MKKKLTMIAALALAVCIGVGGTLAWLTADTKTITNTFTVGKVDITLTETKNDGTNAVLDAEETAQTQSYKVSPGVAFTKDPKVTVKADSEKSILYVKVTKGTDFDTYFTTTVDAGWTELTSAAGSNYKVYYREQAAVAADTTAGNLPSYSVLTGNTVTPKDNITSENLKTADTSLVFQAYAIQYDGLAGSDLAAKAASGWTALNA